MHELCVLTNNMNTRRDPNPLERLRNLESVPRNRSRLETGRAVFAPPPGAF